MPYTDAVADFSDFSADVLHGTTASAAEATEAAGAMPTTEADAAPGTRVDASRPNALIVDWGGVLTSPLESALHDWYAAEGIPADAFAGAMQDFHDGALAALSVFDPVAALERGELKVERFEQELAARIERRCGVPVPAEGLINRMFAGFGAAPAMVNVVRRAKAAGITTALLSNSWGNEYLRDDWDVLFDAVVISGEVGMRKPEPEIYEFTLRQIDRRPRETVFVDDMERNVRAAAAMGLISIHHRSFDETLMELEALFGVELGAR
ncbi:MAG TPA: HAD family phosphatase [Thermoleophilia bacterium]|nr:HAD family phosphatase [Thermoleophilia bacterium]